jgi:hypothetical protein
MIIITNLTFSIECEVKITRSPQNNSKAQVTTGPVSSYESEAQYLAQHLCFSAKGTHDRMIQSDGPEFGIQCATVSG